MSTFSSKPVTAENRFIKHKPEMLQSIYGSTEVFPYWVADMDFQVAAPITETLNGLTARGVYAYEFNESGVFTAIANWYQQRHQLKLSTDKFVQAPGVLSALAILLRQFTQEGDAVLIHTPAYHQFANLITKAQRKVVKSELHNDGEQYLIDFTDVEQQIKQHRVKAMIVCNPHNPTGRVWRAAELTELIAIAKRHNVMIISDEIHADIIYSGHKFTSMASFDYDNMITLLGSPAKTFGMHSIANGYIYTANETLHAAIKANIGAMYLDHGNALSTFATITAYEKGGEWLDGLLDYLQQTLDWMSDYIETHLPQVKMFRPQGTYQVWFDFSGLGLEEAQLKQLLFEHAKMGLTPGSWFGMQDYNFLRMNIATSQDNIGKSLALLAEAVKQLAAGTLCLSTPSACTNTHSCC